MDSYRAQVVLNGIGTEEFLGNSDSCLENAQEGLFRARGIPEPTLR